MGGWRGGGEGGWGRWGAVGSVGVVGAVRAEGLGPHWKPLNTSRTLARAASSGVGGGVAWGR